ncbi:MAG: XRE family transcriptional regulator [Hymenobacter sp.]|nr:MAG: XRE family transcriptional regulator [Hymenobacter sp.]
MKNPTGMKVFSERLRLLRKQQGFSQQKLADIANVEQSTIKRIELTQLAPTLDLLISLSRALEMEVRDLVDDPAITHSDKEV